MQIGINIKDDNLEIKALAREEQADIILSDSQINYIITLYRTYGHPKIVPNDIIASVCNIFDISIKDFNSKSRKRDFVVARQTVMYILKRLDYGTFGKIGFVVKKDHATVMYACKNVEIMLQYKDVFYYNKIMQALTENNLCEKS